MTRAKKVPLYIRSKIWFEDGSGEVVFGLGRLKMLEAIERHGSIQAAAKELKMSYRALWGRITATENRIGRQLLTRHIGGAAGGGSQLTPFAKIILKHYRDLHLRITMESDRLFNEEVLSKITSAD
ncbi:MAG: LysR family transcriptional regulator [Desulfobacteraceae bacterium]|nr:MAG: LysR family transcriptional regulator [Desulfobacteraceae bacterium]